MIGQFSLFVVLALVAARANALSPKKIIGGYQASPGEFPYQVSLRERGRHICGGTIISDRHILTAAHCVAEITNVNDHSVVTGTSSSRYGGEIHTITKIVFPSEHLASSDIVYDIAVIAVHPPIQFNAVQNKLNLPSAPIPGGVTVTLSGWGIADMQNKVIPEKLQKLNMQTITADQCQQYWPEVTMTDLQICTYIDNRSGACQGDSGGPLAYNGEVIGVVSFGLPCARGRPDVFTNVYHYVNWIRKMMAET